MKAVTENISRTFQNTQNINNGYNYREASPREVATGAGWTQSTTKMIHETFSRSHKSMELVVAGKLEGEDIRLSNRRSQVRKNLIE